MPTKSSLLPHEKNSLRKALLKRRKGLPHQLVKALSLKAQNLLIESSFWKKADSVALYYAVRGEVETFLLMEEAWKEGKTVFLPYTVPESDNTMLFLPCPGLHALVKGSFGIMEPAPETCVPSQDSLSPELIIAPGLGFDRKGYRLGSGGGYYDRLLARPGMSHVRRIGLTYADSIFDSLPHEPWDVPMHALACEDGIIDCG